MGYNKREDGKPSCPVCACSDKDGKSSRGIFSGAPRRSAEHHSYELEKVGISMRIHFQWSKDMARGRVYTVRTSRRPQRYRLHVQYPRSVFDSPSRTPAGENSRKPPTLPTLLNSSLGLQLKQVYCTPMDLLPAL